ncbi:Calcium-binding protein 39 [Cladochytrium tenue]|nr:Calcium-binding protein 39 [Cladochytrium tenue]
MPGPKRLPSLKPLTRRYENHEIALNCGMILRECIRHEMLAKIILESDYFWRYFSYVELPTFDVASDAFATFKFYENYTLLLNSSNYVTKRQSIKLLGELLLDRSNYSIMTRYIANVDNLKLMMNLLRDKSKNIQYEAFHVFKVGNDHCTMED